MIKKGWHYLVGCDKPGCDKGQVVGVRRHSIDSKRQVKQDLIKAGWTPGEFKTWSCPECSKPKEKLEFDETQEKALADNKPSVAASGAVTKE